MRISTTGVLAGAPVLARSSETLAAVRPLAPVFMSYIAMMMPSLFRKTTSVLILSAEP